MPQEPEMIANSGDGVEYMCKQVGGTMSSSSNTCRYTAPDGEKVNFQGERRPMDDPKFRVFSGAMDVYGTYGKLVEMDGFANLEIMSEDDEFIGVVEVGEL